MTRTASHCASLEPEEPTQPGTPILATGALRDAAAGLLTRQGAGSSAEGRQMLRAGERLGYDMSTLWTALDAAGEPTCACLITPAPGRLGLAYAGLRQSASADTLGSVIVAAARDAGAKEAQVVQALLETADADSPLAVAFDAAGFTRLAELLFLRRLARADDATLDANAQLRDLTLERWRPALDADFIAALEASYADTLDCPELCDMRDARDALASHKAAGAFDPALWWLVRDSAADPAGVLLINPVASGDAAELVYIGLAPQLRKQGLGSALLRLGIRELAQRNMSSLACAVDSRNAAALRLYERLGFARFASRAPFVRELR